MYIFEMKKKNKKLSTEERDNDLLYEILMSGGTFSDYKQTLSDMNAQQEE